MEYSNEDLVAFIESATDSYLKWERMRPVMSKCVNFEHYLQEQIAQLEQVRGHLKQLVIYQSHLINNLIEETN